MGKKQEQVSKKKKAAVAATGLALATMIMGTFAWTSYTEWIKNHMQSKGFEDGRVTIVEEFPNPEITIGGELTKKVSVSNTSSEAALVRVSFEEMLHKLGDKAVKAQGFATTAEAGFPVIFNAKEYLGTATGWTNRTADLTIDDAAPTDKNLRLYVNGDNAVLFREVTMTKADWPTNFIFAGSEKHATVPVISGDLETSAVVAQKVTGTPILKASTTKYNVSTTGTDAEKLAYHGYGAELSTKKEADWAGEQVFVSTAVTLTDTPKNSQVDSELAFKMPSVTTILPTATPTGDQAKWFYDETSGYFYYLDRLDPSVTTSQAVLEAIQFPEDESYNIASYDLYVGLESIPASRAAMERASKGGQVESLKPDEAGKIWTSNDSGWGLTNADPIYNFYITNNLLTITEK